jgi:hypothetical protein
MLANTALAETEGFEPSVREYPVRRFSKPLVSATHPRLRKRHSAAGYIGGLSKLQLERCYFARTSSRMSSRISSPGSSTPKPSSGQSGSGAFIAAFAWLTGSATKNPPLAGE